MEFVDITLHLLILYPKAFTGVAGRWGCRIKLFIRRETITIYDSF